MPDQCDFCSGATASRDACCLWVDLTRAGTVLLALLESEFSCIRHLRAPPRIAEAIEFFAPQFLCFEFDDPDAAGMGALALTRRQLPDLPVLMITGAHSEAVALWALRMRVWDLLVKPVALAHLLQQLATLCDVTRDRTCLKAPAADRQNQLAPPYTGAVPALDATLSPGRTQPAIAHVAEQFFCRISLDQVAALCRLSTSQFCRVFRQEHGASFGQYLLRYRIDRACERLVHRNALAKEVAYGVGFNDLSYFAWAFKRQVGVCPSRYRRDPGDRAGAGSS
jgi:two-component system, response regulator YesN